MLDYTYNFQNHTVNRKKEGLKNTVFQDLRILLLAVGCEDRYQAERGNMQISMVCKGDLKWSEILAIKHASYSKGNCHACNGKQNFCAGVAVFFLFLFLP